MNILPHCTADEPHAKYCSTSVGVPTPPQPIIAIFSYNRGRMYVIIPSDIARNGVPPIPPLLPHPSTFVPSAELNTIQLGIVLEHTI